MAEQIFPPEIPQIGDDIRVTPVKVDYVPRNYKFFCEEASVVSRFFGTSYDGNAFCIEVFLNGRYISRLIYNQKYNTWNTNFDDMQIQVEVEKLLQ